MRALAVPSVPMSVRASEKPGTRGSQRRLPASDGAEERAPWPPSWGASPGPPENPRGPHGKGALPGGLGLSRPQSPHWHQGPPELGLWDLPGSGGSPIPLIPPAVEVSGQRGSDVSARPHTCPRSVVRTGDRARGPAEPPQPREYSPAPPHARRAPAHLAAALPSWLPGSGVDRCPGPVPSWVGELIHPTRRRGRLLPPYRCGNRGTGRNDSSKGAQLQRGGGRACAPRARRPHTPQHSGPAPSSPSVEASSLPPARAGRCRKTFVD